MIGLLRFVRGVVGLLFAQSILGIFNLLMTPQDSLPAGITKAAVYAGVAAAFGWLFAWLRDVINRRYQRQHGCPHPKLATSQWAL